MQMKEIARELQGTAANLALRMPISWVNILAGPPVTVDGRTLDTRTQWFLQLLARSGQKPLHELGLVEARREFDIFQSIMGGSPAPVGEIVDRIISSPSGRMRVRLYRPADSVGAPAAGHPVFPWRRLGDRQPRGLRPALSLLLCAHRLHGGRGRLSAGAEHKFPAAVDDAVGSFRWLAEHAVEFGIDPARIVVAGDSAGGDAGSRHQPVGAWRAADALPAVADLSGHGPRGGGAFAQFLRRGLPADTRRHGVVPLPLPE